MKIMAIDYGDAHTGIAISDATGTLAGFSTVINSRRAETVTQEICALIPQHGVTELVLGYPKNMDGTVGPRAEKAAAFGQTLRQLTGLPILTGGLITEKKEVMQALEAGALAISSTAPAVWQM